MTRVTIVGAAGRMGQMLVRACLEADGAALAGAVERPGHPWAGRDAGLAAGVSETGVPIGTDLDAALAASDVAVDFSFHGAVPEHAARCAALGKAMVIGTTGLDAAETAGVRAAAARTAVVWAPNMSMGMNVLFGLVRQAAALLNESYDIEIVEMHHRHKKDAPSGTALGLAKAAAEGRGVDLEAAGIYGRQGQTGERPRGQIGLHAVRGGDVIGDHTVILATDGERLELTHRASGRDAFARGAMRAALWAAGRAPGLYDMTDVLGLKTLWRKQD